MSKPTTVRDLLKTLTEIVTENPDALDYPIVHSADPEGNCYTLAYGDVIFGEDEWYVNFGREVETYHKADMDEEEIEDWGDELKPCVVISP